MAALPTVVLLVAVAQDAAQVASSGTQSPGVAPASEEGRLAMGTFEVPPGMELSLFAAEPLLANPVCFCFDERGDVYVAETFRLHAGVTDIRNHMDWLDDDLASKSVADRVAMYRKHEGERFADYGKFEERIRLIRDTDGDGAADQAVVFADGFRDPADGIAAGLLARKGDVYYTCIPSLWLLSDAASFVTGSVVTVDGGFTAMTI